MDDQKLGFVDLKVMIDSIGAFIVGLVGGLCEKWKSLLRLPNMVMGDKSGATSPSRIICSHVAMVLSSTTL